MVKSGQMVLKGVSWVDNIKIGPVVLGSFGKYMKSGRFHGEIWLIS